MPTITISVEELSELSKEILQDKERANRAVFLQKEIDLLKEKYDLAMSSIRELHETADMWREKHRAQADVVAVCKDEIEVLNNEAKLLEGCIVNDHKVIKDYAEQLAKFNVAMLIGPGGKSFLKSTGAVDRVYALGPQSNRDQEDIDLILHAICQAYLPSGKKINCARTVKDLTGWTIKKAVDYVDSEWGASKKGEASDESNFVESDVTHTH